MAGHSKWANIKRQKARVDAVKGKTFAKMSREIIVSARQGGDPAGNFQLRTAIDKAKAAGVPNDNIDRAIAKGSGNLGADDSYEAIRYEGYGPGGIAVLIEALTDNRNRTAADLRAAFSKSNGNLGETGCVGWMFEQKGVVTIAEPGDEEALLEAAMEGGAETYDLTTLLNNRDEEMPGAEVFCAPGDLEQLDTALKAHGYTVQQVDLRWIPSNTVMVDDSDQARLLIKLMEALEDLDDVQSVTANFDLAEDLLDPIAA
ncbi:YebC/PmpR family DNA-binding transcriptional regulator [Nodosilinea sp. LEGE 07298]|uniref:YebC/PmpR family DNA-binding transcriptional regulator n=1 Tax=Nodosilinea sp. LEGE 07298 TaxID=2777970 RepID=UPI0018827C17|nr:YebC/PmpR family DNA-binding transcriptional regulator [Nodosilinea sp. LEGE 07298]MBE9110974.1 YebC/PmpR family DNA-binding transcriptional regulator [Nodosilinea sp. LEGE 07298]